MKAAVWKQKGRFDIEDVPMPQPGQDEVLIKVACCAVCGSDLHRAYTHGEIEPGVVIGHEFSGTVSAVGPRVTRWEVGDRVVGRPGRRGRRHRLDRSAGPAARPRPEGRRRLTGPGDRPRAARDRWGYRGDCHCRRSGRGD